MKPTIEDLQRLLLDAREEGQAEEPTDPDPGYLIGCLQTCARFMLDRARGGNWSGTRLLALRAMYLCALIAWEAGRRSAPAWHLNVGGKLEPVEGPTAAETPAARTIREATERFIKDAEVERAHRFRVEAQAGGIATVNTRGHLRAVLDWGWPDGTTGPEVVRKARAHLAGEGHALRYDDAREIELLRKELADKGAALERMIDRHEAEKGARKQANAECDKLRAEFATADEAQALLRARLAEVTAQRNYEMKRGAEASARCVFLENQTRDALAAQNQAESAAASMRSEVTDLRRKLAEGDAMVDQLVAWAKKGSA